MACHTESTSCHTFWLQKQGSHLYRQHRGLAALSVSHVSAWTEVMDGGTNNLNQTELKKKPSHRYLLCRPQWQIADVFAGGAMD